MRIDDVMDEIATALKAVPDLRVHEHPVDSLSPPAAEVLYPEVKFDESMGRGVDKMEGGIIVSVSRVNDRAARDAIARFAGGDDSPHSIRAALHRRTLAAEWTSCAFARVINGYGIDHVVGEVLYVAYRFDVDIYGSGK